MRIGIGPFPLERRRGLSLHRVYVRALEHAALAESVGLDAVWVDGNHFTAEAHGPAPLLVAAALAARTRTITIGVATLTLTIGEHPLHVAEEALVVDALSGGRLVLGLGLGYRPEELAAYGVDPAARRARFLDALAVLRRAFAEPPEFPFHGEHYDVAAAVCPEPRPIRPGGPPLWIGGGWSPAAVRRSARLGLPMISHFFETPDAIAEKMCTYCASAAADAPGRHVVPAIRDVFLAPPDAVVPALLRVYRRYAAWGMPLLGRPTRPEELLPDHVRRLALIGEESEVARRLAELADAGVTDVLARVDLPGVSSRISARTIQGLGRLRRALSSGGSGTCQAPAGA